MVDGPKDIRFAMTARTVARQRAQGLDTLNELTTLNVRKVTRFRKDGVDQLEREIKKLELSNGKETKPAKPTKTSQEAGATSPQ